MNSQSTAIDLLSGDATFLDKVSGLDLVRESPTVVSCIKLVETTEYQCVKQAISSTFLIAKSLIPRQIWDNPNFLYVCIEVYVRDEAHLSGEELSFSRELIEELSELMAR